MEQAAVCADVSAMSPFVVWALTAAAPRDSMSASPTANINWPSCYRQRPRVSTVWPPCHSPVEQTLRLQVAGSHLLITAR